MNRLEKPYILWEIANSHGGEIEAVEAIIDSLSDLEYSPAGVKFQVFSAEGLSLEDFSWFENYRNLEISLSGWGSLIQRASDCSLDVWIDIFDVTGVEVINAYTSQIKGLKLQASVLENYEIFSGLQDADLSNAVLILNISGYPVEEIREALERFEKVGAKEIVFQIGFQDYPTLVTDCGLNKIAVLRQEFPEKRISLADHCSGDDEFAQLTPLAGWLLGAEFLEKHFCVDREKAVYDGVSAVEPNEARKIVDWINAFSSTSDQSFICGKETEYLEKSVQTPVSNRRFLPGELLTDSDFIYRRTSQEGISMAKIRGLQKKRMILGEGVEQFSTVGAGSFRKARIGVIIACRLKSTRLKRKALHELGGVTSIERCIDNCRLFEGCDEIIVATSDLDEDAQLGAAIPEDVHFWQGDAEDVISRYLGACEKFGIDIVVRVTGDCPVMFPEITEILLDEHFKSGADYTVPVECAVGSAPEIYNVSALKKVMELKGAAEYSEYMTWYMRNNADIFDVNLVDLPGDLVRDWRLTLDYEEDAEMFTRLYEECGRAPSGAKVVSVLDAHPDIAAINQDLTLRYKTDPELIETLNRETRIVLPDSEKS